MKKSGSLIIFLMLILSACSLKSGVGGSSPTTSASVSPTASPVSLASPNAANNAAVVTAGSWTGTYLYKTGRYHNEFKVQQISDHQLRVQFSGTTEYKLANGDPMADAGDTQPQIVALDVATKSAGVLLPEGADKDCRFTLKFTSNKLRVEQEGFCGFGAKVSAAGEYTRTSSAAPVFGDSADSSLAAVGSSAEQPIRFERGKSSATVTGRIQKGKETIYTFDASAGQTAEVKVTTDSPNNDVVFSLAGPDGAKPMDDVSNEWKGKLPKTGTYKINIGAMESETANFKLTLAIR